MAERYATVVTQDDGTEIVSNIGQFEGKPADPTSKNAKRIKVPDGVKIGMVKGGSVQASGGYGFRDLSSKAPSGEVENPAPDADKKAKS